jgi:hypothetical protein
VALALWIPLTTEATTEYRKIEYPAVVAIYPAQIEHKKVLTGRYIPNNCVLYARSVRPDTPMNLYTLESKKRIIHHKEPRVNDVAVTAESYAGHLSIVLRVEDENILVRESNYTRGISERWIPRDKILGYF